MDRAGRSTGEFGSRTSSGGLVSGVARVAGTVLGLCAVLLFVPHARAQELQTDLTLLGQVRDGDQSRETESPTNFYGDLNGDHRGYHVETFFRLQRDFSLDQGAADFYAGYLETPSLGPGVSVTVGRQFLSQGPVGVYVADAGKVRLAPPSSPVALTVFGGKPQYFEPTYNSPLLSQDEVIYGGNLQTTKLHNGSLSVGYFQQERNQRVLRQLITASGSRSFTALPGMPSFYGNLAYDADHQNLDLGTMGMQGFLAQPRLLFNLEGTYYKPQDQNSHTIIADRNRREDAIFELFSVSRLLQFRGGLRYILTPSLSVFGDYSYQRYDKLTNRVADGHVGGTGVLWLPGGDGLEQVRLEYYVIDGDGGNVNGGKAYYENDVYERLRFRTKLDVTYYEKENNQRDTAVSSLVGLGYVLFPGLVCELNFEANHNMRFNEDFRFGFAVDYKGRFRSKPAEAQPRESL